jgi:hypothetical protein
MSGVKPCLAGVTFMSAMVDHSIGVAGCYGLLTTPMELGDSMTPDIQEPGGGSTPDRHPAAADADGAQRQA